ncbi:MAG: hypothetical protein JWQ35_2425 [Bacteriovoracaceae bacterium]|nr:hypothetical protein [Bacteriovoracaceae bacterium]
MKPLCKTKYKSVKLFGLCGALITLASGCGDDKKSPGDAAKAVTDATVKKANEAKDAVTKKAEETRSEAESRLSGQISALETKFTELEKKQKEETVPAIKTASQKRLASASNSLTDAETKWADLKAASDADWKLKRDTASLAIDATTTQINSLLDRQAYEDHVRTRLGQIQERINKLNDDAQNATAAEKQRLDSERNKLQAQYDELKVQNEKFQTSSDVKWDTFKDKFEKSFKDISDSAHGIFNK